MQDIILSPHFHLEEFVRSATATQHGIVNEPPSEAVENLRKLCVGTLEPLSEALGLPIVITSGYRCKALNDRIAHHSLKSQHMKGQAADFHVGNGSRELLIQAFRQIILDESIDFDQLILYPTFIHVSYVSREANRHSLTRASGDGVYCALSHKAALAIE